MTAPAYGSNIRVGGSGLTIMKHGNNVLGYLQTLQDTAPTPVAQAVPVQAIDDPTPIEIVTALAVGAGTLRMTFMERWDRNVWQYLNNFQNATSLLDVLREQVALGSTTFSKLILNPKTVIGGKGKGTPIRQKIYHGCKIVDIDDGEQINIGTMILPKGITVMYTHFTVA